MTHLFLLFLSKFPEYLFFGSGLGNIHNLAFPYIRTENLYYMKGNIFVAKSGYLRVISELGLLGFCLFSLMTYSIFRKLNYVKNIYTGELQKIIKSMQFVIIIVFIAYMSRSYVFGEFILFLAMANVLGQSKIFFNIQQ